MIEPFESDVEFTNVDIAHAFVRDLARPLEQAVHAVLFARGDETEVVDSLLPYRNDDGGFGHGLEPDKLVPDSQALETIPVLATGMQRSIRQG